MKSNRTVLTLAAVAGFGLVGLSLEGCGSTAKALGMTKVVPDEFRVVTKAPLVVPPDYALRPPAPGQPRPQELQPESVARNALLGQRDAQTRDDGEKLLVEKAGADKADPLIRYVIDDEFGALAHKEPSFADRVLFWRKPGEKAADTGVQTAAQSGANTPAPVDAAAESARLKQLIGPKPVLIARDPADKGKLPGL
ncbi:MAG TPA: DUF3035 domain-containing protein [Caulobacteraceae bacterium]|nr:DUF3035 domain-containing protein [Caulobacteraceae bacterium]